MNIFYLDKSPELSAQFHNDKHVVKMIIEYAQLLSTAHRVLDGKMYFEKSKNNRNIKRYLLKNNEGILYKATHTNHPSAIWVRQSSKHYEFLLQMFISLCNEYTLRYNKVHKTSTLIEALSLFPKNLNDNGFIEPPLAMPDYCKLDDAVQSYRNYYLKEKNNFLNYTNTTVPYWIKKD